MTKPYYYWDFAYRSKDGKTLQECFDSFGTGVQKLQLDDIVMEVIFLDAKRGFNNSWVLRCYSETTGINVPVRLYEENRINGRHALNPKPSLQ